MAYVLQEQDYTRIHNPAIFSNHLTTPATFLTAASLAPSLKSGLKL